MSIRGVFGIADFKISASAGWSFARVFSSKLLHTPGGVDEFLLAGEEGMAARTDLHMDGWLRRAGMVHRPTRARNRRLHVFWMNALFHQLPPVGCRLEARGWRLLPRALSLEYRAVLMTSSPWWPKTLDSTSSLRDGRSATPSLAPGPFRSILYARSKFSATRPH